MDAAVDQSPAAHAVALQAPARPPRETAGDQMQLAQLTETSALDERPDVAERRHEVELLGNHQDAAGGDGRRDHLVGFLQRAGDRLFDEDVLAGVEGQPHVGEVAIVRGADDDGIGVIIAYGLGVATVGRDGAVATREVTGTGRVAAREDERQTQTTRGSRVTLRDPAAAENHETGRHSDECYH